MASRKDWDPRGPHSFLALEKLASKFIGDGKSPNLFFVTVGGKVVAITQDLEVARYVWEKVSAPMITETTIEDRQVGMVAGVQPSGEEGEGPLMRIENFDMLPD